jgi:LemA protein
MPYIIAIVVFLLIPIFLYNNLISKVNQIKNAEGSLDAVLKQRFDLLPSLVEVAKQYMEHEDKMFTKIIELRTRSQNAQNSHEKIETNKELDQTLKTFMVNVENYPTLLSNQNFIKIQESLIGLENNISASRRFYNASIVDHNQAIQMIPGNLMALIMGLHVLPIYSISETERAAPNMKDMFKK